MNYDRFSGLLGEEYNLFKESVSHHDELQQKVGDAICDYYTNKLQSQIVVFECGCGTGFTSLRILTADERVRLIAVDNEPKTLNQAKLVLSEFGSRVEFILEDVLQALKQAPSQSVDVVASAYTIHNFIPAYRKELFCEMARVLKLGGLFVNGDKYAQDDSVKHGQDLVKQIKAFDVYDTLGRSDVKAEWIKHYLEDDKIKFTEKEQRILFQEFGFTSAFIYYRQGMEAISTAVNSPQPSQKI